MIQRGGNRNFRYTPNARNTPDASVPPQGIMSAMLPVPLEIGGVPVANADSGNNQPLPISALASALASAPPEQQRAVCFFTFLSLDLTLY
jgi:polyadenylate-binding protein